MTNSLRSARSGYAPLISAVSCQLDYVPRLGQLERYPTYGIHGGTAMDGPIDDDSVCVCGHPFWRHVVALNGRRTCGDTECACSKFRRRRRVVMSSASTGDIDKLQRILAADSRNCARALMFRSGFIVVVYRGDVCEQFIGASLSAAVGAVPGFG